MTKRRGQPDARLCRPAPRGFTLVEMTVSLAVLSILLVAIGSAVMLAAKTLPQESDPSRETTWAVMSVEDIATELQYALAFTERSATAVEFAVADRDSDGSRETIRYAWSGTAGDPLTREYNGASAVTVVDGVREFELLYDKLVRTKSVPIDVESAEIELVRHVNLAKPKSFAVTSSNWIGQYFYPSSLPTDAILLEENVFGGGALSPLTLVPIQGGTDQTYVLLIATNDNGDVTFVTGGGLTWTERVEQCSGRSQQGSRIWTAQGSPVSAFSVKITYDDIGPLSPNLSAVLCRYSDVGAIDDPTGENTNGESGACSAGTDTANPQLTLTSTVNGSVHVIGVNRRNTDVIAFSPGYTLHGSFRQGAGGSATTMSVYGTTFNPAKTDTFTATLSGIDDWSTAGIVLRPAVAGAITWKVTRVLFQARTGGLVDGFTKVQLRVADQADLPTGIILDQVSMSEASLDPATYMWENFAFSNVADLPPNRGLCLVLQWTSGAQSADILYTDEASGRLETLNAGASWSSPASTLPYYVYGTFTQPGTMNVNRTYLTGVRIKLRAGEETVTLVQTSTPLLHVKEIMP